MYVINYICRIKPVAAPRLEGKKWQNFKYLVGCEHHGTSAMQYYVFVYNSEIKKERYIIYTVKWKRKLQNNMCSIIFI